MSDVRAKLAELGLTLPVASKPVAAYVPAIRTGNLVFTAGQLPMVDGKIVTTGKIGGPVTPEQGKELAQICALNALAAVETVANIDDIVRVVRVVGYVNGASELFVHIWGEAGKHARSAIGVADLPLDAPVEIELTVEVST